MITCRFTEGLCLQPYHLECTRSRLIKVETCQSWMSDRLGIQVAVDSSSFVVRRFSFWSVQGICIALLTYQSKRVLQGLSKRPSLHSLITLLKRCVSQMQSRLCMLSSGPMKAAHALDSTKNMKGCSKPVPCQNGCSNKHSLIQTLAQDSYTYLAWGSTMIKKVVPLG